MVKHGTCFSPINFPDIYSWKVLTLKALKLVISKEVKLGLKIAQERQNQVVQFAISSVRDWTSAVMNERVSNEMSRIKGISFSQLIAWSTEVGESRTKISAISLITN